MNVTPIGFNLKKQNVGNNTSSNNQSVSIPNNSTDSFQKSQNFGKKQVNFTGWLSRLFESAEEAAAREAKAAFSGLKEEAISLDVHINPGDTFATLSKKIDFHHLKNEAVSFKIPINNNDTYETLNEKLVFPRLVRKAQEHYLTVNEDDTIETLSQRISAKIRDTESYVSESEPPDPEDAFKQIYQYN